MLSYNGERRRWFIKATMANRNTNWPAPDITGGHFYALLFSKLVQHAGSKVQAPGMLVLTDMTPPTSSRNMLESKAHYMLESEAHNLLEPEAIR